MLDQTELESIVASFDLFRDRYTELSFEDLKYIYQRYYTLYPVQVHFDAPWFARCITQTYMEIGSLITVCELGGYQGELAKEMFSSCVNLIESWTNYDLFRHVHVQGLPKSYQEIVLPSYFWHYVSNGQAYWTPPDLFVSSDTIEHFSNEEVVLLFESLITYQFPYLALKIHVGDETGSRKGEAAAHLMTFNVSQLKEILSPGYTLIAEKRVNGSWCSFWKD